MSRRLLLLTARKNLPLRPSTSDLLWNGFGPKAFSDTFNSRRVFSQSRRLHNGTIKDQNIPPPQSPGLPIRKHKVLRYILLGAATIFVAYSNIESTDFEVTDITYLSEDKTSAFVTLRRRPQGFFSLRRKGSFDPSYYTTETALYDITIADKAPWYVPWRAGNPRSFTPVIQGHMPPKTEIDLVVQDLDSARLHNGTPDHTDKLEYAKRHTRRRLKKASIPKSLERVTIVAGGSEGLAPALQILHCLLRVRQDSSPSSVLLVWHAASGQVAEKAKDSEPLMMESIMLEGIDSWMCEEMETLAALHPERFMFYIRLPHESATTIQTLGLEEDPPGLRLWGHGSSSGNLFVAAGSADFTRAIGLPDKGDLKYTRQERMQIAKDLGEPEKLVRADMSRWPVLRLTDGNSPATKTQKAVKKLGGLK